MDKETFDNKIKELGEMETPEEMRAGLAELQEAVSSVYEDNANMKKQHDDDTIEMESIRQANMKLFTQLGSQKTPEQTTEEQTGLKQDEPKPRRKFEDLFDDKGNFIKH
jgi:regulator of replication initiation timing